MKLKTTIGLGLISVLFLSCSGGGYQPSLFRVEIPFRLPDVFFNSKIQKMADAVFTGYDKEFRYNLIWCNTHYNESVKKFMSETRSNRSFLNESLFGEPKKNNFSPVISDECHLAYDFAKKKCFSEKAMEYCAPLISNLSSKLGKDKMLVRTLNYIQKNKSLFKKQIRKHIQQNKIIVLDDSIAYQNSKFEHKYTFDEAKEYCSNLEYAKYDDWRLPTYGELKKLIIKDTNVTNQYGYLNFMNASFIENLPNKKRIVFWTSYDKSKKYPNNASGVNFTKGKSFTYKKSSKNYVMCVKEESF